MELTEKWKDIEKTTETNYKQKKLITTDKILEIKCNYNKTEKPSKNKTSANTKRVEVMTSTGSS